MGLKVLLGDTSPITRKVFSLSLETLDYTPIFVDNEEGFREVMEKENPDLAILSSNITSNPRELIDEIISNYPQTRLILLKSPFEKIEVDEARLFKVLIKPVPSSKIREIISELKSEGEEVPSEEKIEVSESPEEKLISEEEYQQEELSEEELQAKTWESHSTEEVFPEEEMFPEEEIEEESAFVEGPVVEPSEEEIVLEESAEQGPEQQEIPAEEEVKVEEKVPEEEPAPQVAEAEAAREVETGEVGAEEYEVTTSELERALKQAAPEIIEKIAWEIIPPLAEKIIREEIEKLKKEIEES